MTVADLWNFLNRIPPDRWMNEVIVSCTDGYDYRTEGKSITDIHQGYNYYELLGGTDDDE